MKIYFSNGLEKHLGRSINEIENTQGTIVNKLELKTESDFMLSEHTEIMKIP